MVRKRTRRQFLEDSMFAAAAAAAAGSAGKLLADEEKQSESPNERLNVCVMGVNGRGGSHIGAFAGRKDTEITYICDVDSAVGGSKAKEIAKRQGGREPQFEQDIRRVLDDKSVDIVTIATPNHWHSLAAIWAIQAGKDVYVEKPVSHNVSEGRRVVEAARKHGKICQTGTQCRSMPGTQAIIEYLRKEELGPCKFARGLCYKKRDSIGPRGEYQPPATVDYNLWLGPAPLERFVTRPKFHYDWHWQWAYGNGDLGNQGIHQMDLARWGLGVDELSQGVLSYGGRFGYEDAGETANTQIVIHNYGDKTLVFEVRGLKTDSFKGANVGVVYECSDGYVVMPSYSSGSAFNNKGEKIRDFSGEADHFSNFLKAVRSRKHEDLNADILEGHLSSGLCHLGNISYRLGEAVPVGEALDRIDDIKSNDGAKETFERTLEHLKANNAVPDEITVGANLAFDPKSETFKDNSKADQMLTREYRKPFVVPASGEV